MGGMQTPDDIIAEHLAEGLDFAAIAKKIRMPVEFVKSRYRAICYKLGVDPDEE